MHDNRTVGPLNIKIIWGALTASIVMYGIVLWQVGKFTTISTPEPQLTQLQTIALAMNVIVLLTFFIYRSKIAPLKNNTQKFPLFVLCWALNESIAIMAFLATFLASDGNGIIFIINASMAILGNLLTFPRD